MDAQAVEELRAACGRLESVRPGTLVRVEVRDERGELVGVIDFRFGTAPLTNALAS